MKQFPGVSKALIEYLEDLYPNRAPSLSDTDREVWYKAGRASVVDKLKQLYEKEAHQSLGSS